MSKTSCNKITQPNDASWINPVNPKLLSPITEEMRARVKEEANDVACCWKNFEQKSSPKKQLPTIFIDFLNKKVYNYDTKEKQSV